MKTPPNWARCVASLVVVAGSMPTCPAPAHGGEILGKVFRGLAAPVKAKHRERPATVGDCAIEQLADEIDWLEHHIDRFGSIVAKHPDVWGQSRLTRHRVEYEEKLKDELGNFQDLNSASLRRSDQSFLGMALAIQGMATGGEMPKPEATTSVMNLIMTGSDPEKAVPFERSKPFAKTAGGEFATFRKTGEDEGLGLEPTIHLDHLDGYLKHLQELRRINEGDDNADSPGYALNLVRIPVSIMPGKFTQAGHGAEITVTADLQLGDDLLPTTFRNLVINDVIDTIAPSLTFAANDPEARRAAWTAIYGQQRNLTITRELECLQNQYYAACEELARARTSYSAAEAAEEAARKESDPLLQGIPQLSEIARAISPGITSGLTDGDNGARLKHFTNNFQAAIKDLNLGIEEDDAAKMAKTLLTAKDASLALDEEKKRVSESQKSVEYTRQQAKELRSSVSDLRSGLLKLRSKLAAASPVAVPSTKSRRSRLPIPPSQFNDVGGDKQVAFLILEAYKALSSHPANSPCIDYNDVRGLLGEELQAAYDLLAQPQYVEIWSNPSYQTIPNLIRTRQIKALEAIRSQFFHELEATRASASPLVATGQELPTLACQPDALCANDPDQNHLCATVTGVLAWMIVVESTLLNEQLIEDMRSAASLQGRSTPPGGAWSGPYFGPNPSPEARRSFNDYVRLRWPIRVFALDPVTQEQNIEDLYSKQREMQIALAVAAGGGRLNSQAAMRYARRLETDMATIALNKTAVAFSHGSDTFGWRFYPRFQSPPTRNNLAAFADTLIGSNSQKRDLADRRLEPGIRECTAIIVMPSFVPFVTFDVRTNWFSLNQPRNTDQSLRQTLELSRSIKAMQNSAAQCSQCAGLYRDGEVARLMRRVEQLERELPLQSMLTQIPYENTSGGFELFNTGITDLAPELIGWYGAPGIDTSGATTLFLIGKGFSVLDTKIIAGGQLATDVELISRQVVKIVIPPGVNVIRHPAAGDCRTAEAASTSTPTPVQDTPPAASLMPARATISAHARPSRKLTARRVVQVSGVEAPSDEMPRDRKGSRGATASAVELQMPHVAPEGEVVVEPIDCPPPRVTGSLPEPLAQDSSHIPFCSDDVFSVEEPDSGCGADCTTLDVIDVHLATPYGVSGHLLIPCIKTTSDTLASDTCDGLSLRDDVLITLFAENVEKSWRLRDDFRQSPPDITINAPRGFIPPTNARLNFLLHDDDSGNSTTMSIPAPPFDTKAGTYRITGADLQNLIGNGAQPSGDSSVRGALKPIVQRTGSSARYTVSLVLATDRQQEPISGRFDVHVDVPTAGKK